MFGKGIRCVGLVNSLLSPIGLWGIICPSRRTSALFHYLPPSCQ